MSLVVVEPRVCRKLAAILSMDVAGYLRLVQNDKVATVETPIECRSVFSSYVSGHEDRVVDERGDNIPVDFLSLVRAIRGAVEIQGEPGCQNLQPGEQRQ